MVVDELLRQIAQLKQGLKTVEKKRGHLFDASKELHKEFNDLSNRSDVLIKATKESEATLEETSELREEGLLSTMRLNEQLMSRVQALEEDDSSALRQHLQEFNTPVFAADINILTGVTDSPVPEDIADDYSSSVQQITPDASSIEQPLMPFRTDDASRYRILRELNRVRQNDEGESQDNGSSEGNSSGPSPIANKE
jgi:predicted nuclease with TOPRIM domain